MIKKGHFGNEGLGLAWDRIKVRQVPVIYTTETVMSFETVALFLGSSLIKSKTSFLETVSKEKFSLPKFSFIFLQLSSFSKFIFPVDSRRFKPLVIFVK